MDTKRAGLFRRARPLRTCSSRGGRDRGRPGFPGALAGVLLCGLLGGPAAALAHPLGNFSISQYTGIRLRPDQVELHYVVDMAEIPTYQEIQQTGIIPQEGHPSLEAYLARKVDTLRDGLLLEVDGQRLRLQVVAREVIFPAGAGGLPTMKLGALLRAPLPSAEGSGPRQLAYQDTNFPARVGWKEIVAVGEGGVTLLTSSVPAQDRSQELSNYPTDLLNRPPQVLDARLTFGGAQTLAAGPTGGPGPADTPAAGRDAPTDGLALRPNQHGTPRDAFTQLLTTQEVGLGFVVIALLVAAGLGAAHALEPGHGKTIVAAYLVGSGGTAWHAVLLGLIVTLTHTAGVFLLGAITLFASRSVLPERLYPWLSVGSGLAIALLGGTLFLRRYAGQGPAHGHPHPHTHLHHALPPHPHVASTAGHDPHAAPGAAVSLPGLLALGVTGGIVPCPAALVVLLTALALHRVGFGLILIVAFSAGLAAVLIAVGMLMVSAQRLMARVRTEGPLIQRWLPLTSAAVITLLGLAIAIRGLVDAGILLIRL